MMGLDSTTLLLVIVPLVLGLVFNAVKLMRFIGGMTSTGSPLPCAFWKKAASSASWVALALSRLAEVVTLFSTPVARGGMLNTIAFVAFVFAAKPALGVTL